MLSIVALGMRRMPDGSLLVTKVFGTHSVNVRVYGALEDADPGEELPVGTMEPFQFHQTQRW